jgi:MFS family permease
MNTRQKRKNNSNSCSPNQSTFVDINMVEDKGNDKKGLLTEYGSGDILNTNDEQETEKERPLSLFSIAAILSTAFSYGCILTTLFLITLPVECDRIESENPSMPKSVALGIFVGIAGVTQLISPLIGMMSDTYRPPIQFELGQRMPYLTLGGIMSVVGLLGQFVGSNGSFWVHYAIFFVFTMIGLNISYAMMLALIPDQIPKSQTGVANGILALLLVTGSLCGFGLFHAFFTDYIQAMYGKDTI